MSPGRRSKAKLLMFVVAAPPRPSTLKAVNANNWPADTDTENVPACCKSPW